MASKVDSAKVRDEAGYRALLSQLDAMAPGEYITDECIDRENVLVDGFTEEHPDYWRDMAAAAESAAAMRLEDMKVAL